MRDLKEEQELIAIAFRLRYISAKQMQECREILNHNESDGHNLSLLEILQNKKYLTPQQLESIKTQHTRSGLSTTNLNLDALVRTSTAERTKNNPEFIPDMRAERLEVSGENLSTKKFGRYGIIKELGKGGMGVVYHAYDPQLKRHVALKIINQPMATEKDIKRFEREAHLMAKLKHPHIVQILDVGQEQGLCFFTMELVEGVDLKKFLEDNIPIPRLIRLCIKVAQAVYYANSEGIVHRDLKPSNILIDKQEDPKILDFGLAKDITSNDQLSQSGDFLGTPQYMSPEQAEKGKVDVRSDVYALGVILYEMLVGKPPFAARTFSKLIQKIVTEEPSPPSRLHPSIPRELDTICLKALEKDKSRRYQNALEFADDLGRYLEDKPIRAKPVTTLVRFSKWIHRHRVMSIVSFAAIFLMTVVVISFIYQLRAERERAVQERNKADSLRKEAEKQRQIAEEQKSLAQVKEIEARNSAGEAILSQAESELLLAKNHIENQNYYHANDRYSKADTLLQEAKLILEAQSPQQSATRSSREKLWKRQQALARAGGDMWRYCIGPHQYQSETTDLTKRTGNLFSKVEVITPSQPSWKLNAIYYPNQQCTEIWDIEQNRPLKSFSFRPCPRALAFSQEDKWIAMGDANGRISVWERDTDKMYTGTIEHSGRYQEVRSLRFSPDGKWLFSSSRELVVLWRFPEMTQAMVIPYEGKYQVGIFSANSKWLAIGGIADAVTVSLFDLNELKGDARPRPQVISMRARALCFGPEDKSLLLGDLNDIVSFPFAVGHEKFTILGAHRGKIQGLALSPDNNFLASVGQDGRMVLWSVYNYRKILEAPVVGYQDEVSTIDFHPQKYSLGIWNGPILNFYSWYQGLYKKLDILKRKEVAKFNVSFLANIQRSHYARNLGDSFVNISLDPQGKNLACHIMPTLYLWNTEDDRMTPLLTRFNEGQRHMAFSHDSSMLLWRGRQKAYIWDTDSREQIFSAKADERDDFYQSNFIAGDPPLVSILRQADKNLLAFWKIEKGKPIQERKFYVGFTGNQSPSFNNSASKMAFSVFYEATGAKVEVWDIQSPQGRLLSLGDIEGLSPIDAICFSAEPYLALGTQNGDFILYDWQSKQILQKNSLYQPIRRIWYDAKDKLHWIEAKNALFFYPYPEEALQTELFTRIYPLPFYPGYPILASDIDAQFSKMAVSLLSGEILILKLKPTER